MRIALSGWAFNTPKRTGELPGDIAAALRWAARHSRPVSALADPEVLRRVLDGLTTRLDGQPYAPSVISRRRKILNAAVEYAVERKLLDTNPIPALKWAPPRPVQAVDRRRVANPVQVRTLLAAVEEQRPSGRRLIAFFGCLYFSGLRPEEAVGLHLRHLDIPRKGWGMLYLDQAEPHAGKDWTDSGANRDSRQLKQRERGRCAPCRARRS
jgi:integrase